ncbi:helix-turn-helix domain-containing protein [Owenweeksia hongkongensis]|uniref:helix-turn-helix domain-containing protein n=1 Tax=Owenweeksia hongkongensis TaxID=253245 RepID=UPI003A911507
MNIITISEEKFNELTQQITEIRNAIHSKPKGEIVYDNSDVIRLLKVSQRTLATWREDGTLKYSKIGAKIYYKPEHVQEMLDAGLSTNLKKR